MANMVQLRVNQGHVLSLKVSGSAVMVNVVDTIKDEISAGHM